MDTEHLSIETNPTFADVRFLEDRLYEYNRSSLPILEKGEQFPRVSCILTPFCSHY